MLAIEHPSRVPVISDTPTLILGMDVSHGSPGRSDLPSIAAVRPKFLFFRISFFFSLKLGLKGQPPILEVRTRMRFNTC